VADRAFPAYPGSVKLKLDLHDIYNQGGEIDKALQRVFDEAIAKKAPMIEIIPGKGSGQLKKHVVRFLERKDIRPLYHRVEKDSKNFGRLFVHFRWLYQADEPHLTHVSAIASLPVVTPRPPGRQ
jgi:DNA-nicking Smr family endonuclease